MRGNLTRTPFRTAYLHANTHTYMFKVSDTHPYQCSPTPHIHTRACKCLPPTFASSSMPLPPTQNTTHTRTHSLDPSNPSSPPPLHASLPCSRLWRLSCACWCSSSTHSGLLHEPNTFTLCCHGDLKWAVPPLLLLPPPPPLLLLWFPSPWLLLLPPRLPLSASSPLVAGGEEGGEKRMGGRDVERK